MHVLFVIDPLDTLNLTTETSVLLMEELARRGHSAAVATLPDLYLTELGAGVRAAAIRLRPSGRWDGYEPPAQSVRLAPLWLIQAECTLPGLSSGGYCPSSAVPPEPLVLPFFWRARDALLLAS